jgi:ribosomal protein S27AE
MSTKQKGICPFCGNNVAAEIIEENTIRRDRCKCPECGETVFLCRTPGCHDFAKGTQVYDHELCPSCTSTVADAGSGVAATVGKVVGAVAIAALSAVAVAAVKKK